MTRVRGPEIRNAANSTSLAFAGESSAHILHLTLGPLGGPSFASGAVIPRLKRQR